MSFKKAHIIVSSQTESKNASARGVESGRYWLHQAYYLYPLVWDPFVLTRLEGIPSLRERSEPIGAADNSLLLFTHPNTAEDRDAIEEVLGQGGNVVLNHPDSEIESLVADEGFCGDDYGETISSLRERWHFNALETRPYIYPHTQQFLRLNPESGQVLSRIGGNPDLVLGKRAAIFAGDPIAAVDTYQFTPDLMTRLMGDMSALLAFTVAHFTESPITSDEQKKLRQRFELRRDFHAFGYAHWMVSELDCCYGGNNVNLLESESLVMAAAEKAVHGTVRETTDLLRKAFEALEKENRKIQPIPAVFTDVLHGGELFEDIGFFEIDWPEHPADVLRIYLEWVKTRSYRFNVDLGATTVRELAKRFPDLFDELKKQYKRGRVEFVNGSCNQPYPPFHSLESQIRQFDTGRQVWRDVFDTTPETYASQEFGFCPQIASVLKQQGYNNAVIRVQNMGDAPTIENEQIDWEAPNGDRLRSLPSHPHKSESQAGNDYTYHNLHLKLVLHGQAELPFAIFTCLGDITYNRYMREELARVCHYAPVFGRFDTMGSYFHRSKEIDAPTVRFEMQDFNCDAAFINLDIWKMYKNYTGNYNSNCVNSMRSTHLFAAAELINAITVILDQGSYQAINHEKNWEALTHYQGHGTYIVPYHESGGFQGPGDNPANHAPGRGVQEVAEYLGPIDFRQVKQVTDKLMAQSHSLANECISNCLSAISASTSGKGGYCLYNYAQERQMLVRIPNAAGRNFCQADQVLYAQDDGPDRLLSVSLPAYGYAMAKEATTGVSDRLDETVVVGKDTLENHFLRLEFDLKTGTLCRMIDKASGREVLTKGSHAFYFPQSLQQVCCQSKIRLRGPLRGSILFNIELKDDCGNRCTIETVVSLDVGQTVAAFETKVLNIPKLEGDQWRNHLGVRFAWPDANTGILTSHFNVLESFSHKQIFSPKVLVARSETGDTVFLNEGNQFYVRDGNSLRHIMIMENEPLRKFRYAIGLADHNPIMQSLKWSQPCFVQRNDKINASKCVSQSFIDFDNENIDLLSCRYEEGALLIRLANTIGTEVQATLTAFESITSASVTGLDGKHKRSLNVNEGRVKLNLRPWDIRQLRITL